jgi:hypothetical protein
MKKLMKKIANDIKIWILHIYGCVNLKSKE